MSRLRPRLAAAGLAAAFLALLVHALPLRALAAAVAAPGSTFTDSAGLDSARADSARADSARGDSPADSVATAPAAMQGPLLPDTAAAAALLEVAGAAQAETTEIALPTATVPVFLGGRELVRIRSPREGLDPAERAAAIRRRLSAVVADRKLAPDSVKLVSSTDGVELRLGTALLMVITPGDAPTTDPNELGLWLANLAEDTRDGIRRERSGRTPVRLLISAGLAVLFTLIAIALFRVLVMLSKRWHLWLSGYLRERLPAIRIRNFEVLSRYQLSSAVLAVLGRLDVVVGLLMLYAYLTSVFSLFPYTQGWAYLLLHFATTHLRDFVLNVGRAIPGLIVIVVIFGFFRWLAQLSDRFFDAIRDGNLAFAGFHPDLARPSKRLVRILLWIIALMISYPYIPGAQSKAVQGVSILLGLMVSIGSTSVVGNVLAGLVLTYSRSFRTGERVSVGGHVGDVITLGFFATKIRTIRNEEVTIPNGQVATGSIINYTRLADGLGLVLHTEVTIGYDVDWRKVHALLVEAAKRVEGIEHDPEPYVFQTALDDSYVSYEINAVTHDSHAQRRLYSDLHAAIQDTFNEAGVEILSPAFSALRDGNEARMPDSPKGPRPGPGAFRVRRDEAPKG